MRTKVTLWAAAAFAGFFPVVSAAQAPLLVPKFSLFGGGQYAFADSARNVDDGAGFFVGASVPIVRWLDIDFSAFHQEFGGEEANDADVTENGFKADFLFMFSRNRLFQPYTALGAGYVKTRLDGTGFDEDGSSLDFGVGFKSFPFLNGRLGILGDVRYRWLNSDDYTAGLAGTDDYAEDVIVRLGLIVPFGNMYQVTPVTAPPTAALPEEPEAPVTEMEAERRFEDVNFAFDRYDLSPTATAILDNAASTINELSEQYPRLRVKVDGHTDWVGTDGYNMGLGERRANAVKQYLTRKGVAPERIDTTSYGESKPIDTNETAEGRARNRRAEVRTTAEE